METLSTPVLYHSKWYTSSIPLNVIKELDIPDDKITIRTLTRDEMKTDEEFGKASPRRINPVLALPEGISVLETGAITMYLLERFDKDGVLHPPSWDERRPKFLQGMFYAMTDSFQKVMDLFQAVKEDKVVDEEKVARLKKDIKNFIFDHLEKELKCGQSDFYLGNDYSAVDIMFAYLMMCLEYCEVEITSPVVKEYFDRLKAKDAYKLAYTPTEEEMKEHEERERARAQNGTGNKTA